MYHRVEAVFRARIDAWRERIAVQGPDRQLSYDELDRRSNSLAHRLRAHGLTNGEIAGVATAEIERFSIATLAILKAGGAYLPIDTRYPVERVREILEDAAPMILLADATFPQGLVPPATRVLRDYLDDEALAGFSEGGIEPTGSADDTAYVCYTSGSTGQPKGIEIAHRGIPNLVSDLALVPFTPADRVAQASNLAFDAITFELWGALLHGASLVHLPREVLLCASSLAEHIESQQLTVLFLTTSLFNALAGIRCDAFGKLDTLLIGGEAADPASVEKVLRSGRPPKRLVNGYGPTETTTFATCHEVTLADLAAKRIPIGKPLHNVTTRILDSQMRPVATGEPGELCVGGVGLAKGYLRRPDLTHERFVADPLRPDGAERIYRTGDECRELPDGSIVYERRMDDQVKIRGLRVEPSDVAAILRSLPGVEEAVVLGREAAFGTKELVGFVRGREVSPKELRRKLAALLPGYMIPAVIRHVEDFPLTANGKLDRATLLAGCSRPDAGNFRERTSTALEVEDQLRAIWERLLAVSRVGLNDDFFSLGGHSLLAIELLCEIERSFGVDVPIVTFLQNPTIKQLASVLQTQDATDSTPALFTLKEGRSTSPLFIINGGPWAFRLAKNLDCDQPIFATYVPLQLDSSQGAKCRRRRIPTVEEMAAEHVRLILAHELEGPYHLSGHSFQGLLAFEIAHQLQRKGKRVNSVLLVDTWRKVGDGWRPWIKWHLRNLMRKGPRYLAAKTRARLKFEYARRVAALGRVRSRLEHDKRDRTLPDAQTYRAAYRKYQPAPLQARGVLFRAQTVPPQWDSLDPDLGWTGRFVDGLEVVNVAGTHHNLIHEPHLQTFAQQFEVALQDAARRKPD